MQNIFLAKENSLQKKKGKKRPPTCISGKTWNSWAMATRVTRRGRRRRRRGRNKTKPARQGSLSVGVETSSAAAARNSETRDSFFFLKKKTKKSTGRAEGAGRGGGRSTAHLSRRPPNKKTKYTQINRLKQKKNKSKIGSLSSIVVIDGRSIDTSVTNLLHTKR